MRATVAPPSARWLSWLAAAAVGSLVAGLVVWSMTRAAVPAAAGLVEFQIGPPDGSSWDRLPSTPNAAVSPDGKAVAFVGATPAGRRLFVRA